MMTTSLKQVLYREFLAGRTWFDWLFLLSGLALQVLVFWLAPSEPIVIVSGLSGILSVVLCAEGKISYYVFGFLQVVTYLIISFRQQLYAEVGINVFYFVTMIWGVYNWWKRYHVDEQTGSSELAARKLTAFWWVVFIVFSIVGSVLVGWGLSTFTNDSDPYLDAFSAVPAIIAQMLLVMGYREQWFFWFLIDMFCVWLWSRAGNWSIAALYAFWSINCIKGYIHWTSSANQNSEI